MGILYTASDDTIVCQITREGNIWAIPSGASFRAVLVDAKTRMAVSSVKTILETDSQNDWPQGIFAVPFTAAETMNYDAGAYGIEVKIVSQFTYRCRSPYLVEVVESALV